MGKVLFKCNILAFYSIMVRYCLALCQWITDRMGMSPILSIIQPITIDTFLSNNESLLNNLVSIKDGGARKDSQKYINWVNY